MLAAGWSAGVMDAYLLLCERAAANFPIEAFARHVSASMDATAFRQENWNSSGTSAGVSTAIQRLAEAHYPLTRDQARRLLILLDRLVAWATGEQRPCSSRSTSEAFRSPGESFNRACPSRVRNRPGLLYQRYITRSENESDDQEPASINVPGFQPPERRNGNPRSTPLSC
jgi:hypothetical protein